MRRRTFLRGLAAAGGLALAGPRIALGAGSPSTAARLTADFHSHAWRRPDFVTDLASSGVNLVVMAATADRLLLNRDSGRQRALGTAAPGALHASTIEQLGIIEQAIEQHGLIAIRAPADAERARGQGKPGILVGCEGGDMLEGSRERLRELHTAGVRLNQLDRRSRFRGRCKMHCASRPPRGGQRTDDSAR